MTYSQIFIILGHYSKMSSHWNFSTCFAIRSDTFKWSEYDRVFIKLLVIKTLSNVTVGGFSNV